MMWKSKKSNRFAALVNFDDAAADVDNNRG